MATGAEEDDLSYAVVEAVASRRGVDPTELTPGLKEVVDPESLDRLFPEGTGSGEEPVGRVEFHFCGYDVTVYSDGRVDVEA